MPPETGSTHTQGQTAGVFITLREIHSRVIDIDDKLDNSINELRNEISKLKAQLAAQWVVHGILVTAIVFLVQKGLSL